jgi:hypothetical protein
LVVWGRELDCVDCENAYLEFVHINVAVEFMVVATARLRGPQRLRGNDARAAGRASAEVSRG